MINNNTKLIDQILGILIDLAYDVFSFIAEGVYYLGVAIAVLAFCAIFPVVFFLWLCCCFVLFLATQLKDFLK